MRALLVPLDPSIMFGAPLSNSVEVFERVYAVEYAGAHLKAAYRHAIDNGFDYVVQLNAAPKYPSDLIANQFTRLDADASVDALLLSLKPETLWQRFLTGITSFLLRRITGVTSVQDWFPAVRIYRVKQLGEIAFELNTYEAHFQTELILQLLHSGRNVLSRPAEAATTSQDATVSVALLWNSLKSGVKYRLQRVNLFYDFRYHPEMVFGDTELTHTHPAYNQKFLSDSPHSFVLKDPDLIRHGSRVLDIGCAGGYVAQELVTSKSCQVTGVDMLAKDKVQGTGFNYYQMNLETDVPRLLELIDQGKFDYILLLDVLEHLSYPELFLLQLYRRPSCRDTVFVISTANVAFFVIRFMLLLGYFNYGRKGILDVTHKRLFSVRTFKNLLDQTGFVAGRRVCFPLPYQELGFGQRVSHMLESIHRLFLKLRPSLFAYQVLHVATSSLTDTNTVEDKPI